MALILPSEWRSQPQAPCRVDHGNPLSRGIAFAFNAAHPIEVVSGRLFAKTASFSAGAGRFGRYVSTTSGSTPALTIAGFSPIPSSDGTGSGHLTIVCLAAPAAAATSYGLVSQRDGTTPFAQVGLAVNGNISRNSSGNFGITQYNSTGNDALSSAGSMCNGNPHMYAGSRDVNGDFVLYFDGNSVAFTETSPSVPSVDIYVPGNQEFAIGGLGEWSGNAALNTPIYFAAGWNRLLSAAEHAEIYRNPWQLFAPVVRRIWVSSTADSISALTGSSATASAGTAGVSTDKALSGDSATSSAGTLGVSVTVALSGSEVTVSTGTLTPTMNDVTVALTGEAVTCSAGTLSLEIAAPMAGEQVAAQIGSLTANGGDVAATPTGGGIGHGGFSRLIIVEVDGEEFRVPESQLKAFLAALRETVEEAPLRITKKRKKEAPKPVEVRIIHVPKEIKPYVALEIDRTTELINRIVHNAFMEHMQELDDEEALLLLL